MGARTPPLLVGDASRVRARELAALLEPAGYSILTVHLPDHLLQQARAEDPLLIIVDQSLWGSGVVEGVRGLKADQHTAAIPLLLILREEHSNLLEQVLPVEAVLSTPWERQELLAQVQVLARSRELSNEMASLDEVAATLLQALALREPAAQRHAQGTASLAQHLGAALGLPPKEQKLLYLAGLLHDVGKLGVREELLTRPGPLEPQERQEVQRHATLGHEVLRPLRRWPELPQAVLSHHERWDGGGYPHGLRGEEIPLTARILAVADVYEALTGSRPYRAGMTPSEALQYLKRAAGTQFDPRVVEAFGILGVARGRASLTLP